MRKRRSRSPIVSSRSRHATSSAATARPRPGGIKSHSWRVRSSNCDTELSKYSFTSERPSSSTVRQNLARVSIVSMCVSFTLILKQDVIGISILPAPDGTFLHPRAAEPTKRSSSHHRPAPATDPGPDRPGSGATHSPVPPGAIRLSADRPLVAVSRARLRADLATRPGTSAALRTWPPSGRPSRSI